MSPRTLSENTLRKDFSNNPTPTAVFLPHRTKRLIQLVADVMLITLGLMLARLLRLDNFAFLGQPKV
jgi:hypothetical protein